MSSTLADRLREDITYIKEQRTVLLENLTTIDLNKVDIREKLEHLNKKIHELEALYQIYCDEHDE